MRRPRGPPPGAPRLAARPTSRHGSSSLFAAPQRPQMRPRRARRPCGSAAAVAPGASSLPPPSRALTQHAAAAAAAFHPPSEEGGERDAAEEEAEAARSGRPGLEGRSTAPPAARGPAREPRSGRRVVPAPPPGLTAGGGLGEDARPSGRSYREEGVGVARKGPGRGWGEGALPARLGLRLSGAWRPALPDRGGPGGP